MTVTRRENYDLQEREVIRFAHGALTDTTTFKIAKPKRQFVVEWVQYLNPTGLAEHADDWFTLVLKNGATVVATIADTDADGAGNNGIAADTFIDGVLSAVAGALNGAAGDILTLVATEGGTATLPAGILAVGIKYV